MSARGNSGSYCLALMTEAFGGRGGIAQFNRDYLRALHSARLFERTLVLPRLGRGVPPPECPSLRQGPPIFNPVGYSLNALGKSLFQKPDLLINGHLFHGPLARHTARLSGARLVSVLHGTEIWSQISTRHLAPLLKSDLVICVSEDTRQRYLQQAGDRARSNVAVLPNTVEERFVPGVRMAARAKFSLNQLPVILTVGRLDDRKGYKGHDRIIPIIARLKARGHPARYLIAGEGPDRPRLERMVSEAGIEELVTFLGFVPDEDLPDLYRAADVFALPSTGEGFGIVFIEAMACGTPAIGLDVGGALDALTPFGNAVAQDAFETTLVGMLHGPEPDRVKLSENVRARFGRMAFEGRVKALISEVIAA